MLSRGIEQVKLSVQSYPIRMQEGGYIPSPAMPEKESIRVRDVIDVNLNFGSRSFALQGTRSVVDELTEYLSRERRMRV